MGWREQEFRVFECRHNQLERYRWQRSASSVLAKSNTIKINKMLLKVADRLICFFRLNNAVDSNVRAKSNKDITGGCARPLAGKYHPGFQ